MYQENVSVFIFYATYPYNLTNYIMLIVLMTTECSLRFGRYLYKAHNMGLPDHSESLIKNLFKLMYTEKQHPIADDH